MSSDDQSTKTDKYKEPDVADATKNESVKSIERSEDMDTHSAETDEGQVTSEFVCDVIRTQIDKEIKTKQEITRFNNRILTYIYEKSERSHSYIYDYKFRDYLLSIGCDKEHSNEAIDYLLNSFDGSLDLEELKVFYNMYTSASLNFKPEMHLSKLLNCSLIPGFLDSFLDDEVNNAKSYALLCQKLFKFILNHRLSSPMINEPYLENRIQVANLRQRILFELEKNNQKQTLKNKSICIDQECFQSIKVCCAKDKVNSLIDGKLHTYWQASSAEKCEFHCIQIFLKDNIKLTNISLSSIGSRDDDFLKSVVIEVRAGGGNRSDSVIAKCDYLLTISNEYAICNCFPQEQSFSYVKIVFKRNGDKSFLKQANEHIKIRSIKLVAKKELAKPSKITVQDASICWYFEMLSSMALVQSQLMPNMYPKLLNITKNALKNIPPLSLTLGSKNNILTPPVLEKVDEFLNNFLEISGTHHSEKADAIMAYLSFNLARGHLKAILSSLLVILENYHYKYDFVDLIEKIALESEACLRKSAHQIGMKLLKTDESQVDDMDLHQEAETITVNDELSTEIVLQPQQSTSSNSGSEEDESSNQALKNVILLGTDQNLTITHINLKVKLESVGVIKSALVFLIYSKTKLDLAKFDKFDDFNKEKLKTYYEKRKEDEKNGIEVDDFEICHFEFYNNQADIYFELPICNFLNYVLIKFYRSKDNTSEKISKSLHITNLKVFGCKHENLEIYRELRTIQKISKNLSENDSTSILVNSVLWFLCQLAEQHKLNERKNHDDEPLLSFENFDINDLWKVYDMSFEIEPKNAAGKAPALTFMQQLSASKLSRAVHASLKIPVLVLLYELVNCGEIRNSVIKDRLNSCQYIFHSLCELTDNYDTTSCESASEAGDEASAEASEVRSQSAQICKFLRTVSREVLRNGIQVFFPSEKVRRECFLLMIEKNSTEMNTAEPVSSTIAAADSADVVSSETDGSHALLMDKLDLSLKRPSAKLIFEAFCNLFCSSQSNLINSLTSDTKNVFNSELGCQKIIDFIEKILKLSFLINEKISATSESSEQNDNLLALKLNKLLNSIQSNVFYLVREKLIEYHQLSEESPCLRNLKAFVVEYSKLLITKFSMFSANLSQSCSETGSDADSRKLNVKFLSKYKCQLNTFIYNFILWLNETFRLLDLNTCTTIMRLLLDMSKSLLLMDPCSSDEKKTSNGETELLLKTWTFNSKTRSSIKDLNSSYCYPLASKFLIEFDKMSNLGTSESSSSDAITFNFTDSNDHVHSFSGKLGSNMWSDTMKIHSNSFIQFNIRSPNGKDLKANSSFFLKFTISAYGFSEFSSQITSKDIASLLTSVFGTHLSRVYSKKFDLLPIESAASVKSAKTELDEESKKSSTTEPQLPIFQHQLSVISNNTNAQFANNLATDKLRFSNDYNSELYRILLRAGRFENDLALDRRELSESDYKLLRFLNKLILFYSEPSKDDAFIQEFFKIYETSRSKLGGPQMNELIVKIFCALVWHNPLIKYESIIETDPASKQTKPVKNEQALQALKAAESTRIFIVEQQQRYKVKQQSLSKQSKSQMTPTSLLEVIANKAVYLLKFKRLSTLQSNYELNRNPGVDLASAGTSDTAGKPQSSSKRPTKFPSIVPNRILPSSITSSELFHPSLSLVFDFLFDKHINNLSTVSRILEYKQANASLIHENMELAVDYLSQNVEQLQESAKSNLEQLLVFLSTFFSSPALSLPKYWSSNYFNTNMSVPSIDAATFGDNAFRAGHNATCHSDHSGSHTVCSHGSDGVNKGPFVGSPANMAPTNISNNTHSFPPLLKCLGSHYLQNLYGCGFATESRVRESFYKLAELVLNASKSVRNTPLDGDEQQKRSIEGLRVRLDCFVISLLEIDWDVFDWAYVRKMNLVTYLLNNTTQSMPIRNYLHTYGALAKFKSTSHVLEDVFSFSREKFASKSTSSSSPAAASVLNDSSAPDSPNDKAKTEVPPRAKLTEIPAGAEDVVAACGSAQKPDVAEEESFDLKIFPTLYQSLFQSNSSNKSTLDTDGLLKCLSTEPKNYEQYEKCLVARYMNWKYFSKLKRNFYCESCESILTGNRYVCLECQDKSFCFACFSKSFINTQSSAWISHHKKEDPENSPSFSAKIHLSSHRMLLLDHTCNQCRSLIIGKRIHCEECDDYDLCLMCYKQPQNSLLAGAEETKTSTHTGEHRISIIEPVILVAKADSIPDAEVYLSMHSQFLYSVLTLKLASSLAASSHDSNIKSECQQDVAIRENEKDLKFLYTSSLKAILFMISSVYSTNIYHVGEWCASGHVAASASFSKDQLRLFATYMQENIIGLLSSAIKLSDRASEPSLANSNDLFYLVNQNADCAFEFLAQQEENEGINSHQLIAFVLDMLIKKNDYFIDDTSVTMLINVLTELLVNCDSDVVDTIVKELMKRDQPGQKAKAGGGGGAEEAGPEIVTLLDLVIDWIDQSVTNSQIGLASLYLSLISKLHKSSPSKTDWKRKVDDFLEEIFASVLKFTGMTASPEELSKALSTGSGSSSSALLAFLLQSQGSTKYYNFFYALNFVPVSVSVGEWIEYKNEGRYDGAGILKSKTEFKSGLLKNFTYNFTSNVFNLWVLDPTSRRVLRFKDFKYDVDFRKPDENSRYASSHLIDLNKSLVIKLIKACKNILLSFKVITELQADSPAKAKAAYEEKYIDKKRRTNRLLQQLPSRSSLLLLSMMNMLKEHISRKYLKKWFTNKNIVNTCQNESRQDDKSAPAFSSEDLKELEDLNEFLNDNKAIELNACVSSSLRVDESEVGNFIFDNEFLNWIAKFAILNTNLNAYWKLEHLRHFLSSLLLREGFSSLHSIDESIMMAALHAASASKPAASLSKNTSGASLSATAKEGDSVPGDGSGDGGGGGGNNSQTTIKSSLSSTSSLGDATPVNTAPIQADANAPANDVPVSKPEAPKRFSKWSIFQIKSSDPPQADAAKGSSQKRSATNIEQSADDLKLNLNQYSVVGMCDPSSSMFFSASDMSPSTVWPLDATKMCELNTNKHHKRSLKLLEDCSVKLFKQDASSSSAPDSLISKSALAIIESAKQLVSKPLGDAATMTASDEDANPFVWLSEMRMNMIKYLKSRNDKNTSGNKKHARSAANASASAVSQAVLASFQPFKAAIKMVTNASIVLTSRDLLISLINLSARYQELVVFYRSQAVRSATSDCSEKNAASPFSIRQLNCECEFELLQLLDVLYYTDNSLRYKLFIKNLIYSLNKSQSLSATSVSILSKISLTACELMMPEYKLMKKISWSASDGAEKSASGGKLKSKPNNESLLEENLIFGTGATGTSLATTPNLANVVKLMHSIENGANLSIKPNDIEKLSTTESTLLVVMETNVNQAKKQRQESTPPPPPASSRKHRLQDFKKFLRGYKKRVPSLFRGETKELRKRYQEASAEIKDGERACTSKDEYDEEYLGHADTDSDSNESASPARRKRPSFRDAVLNPEFARQSTKSPSKSLIHHGKKTKKVSAAVAKKTSRLSFQVVNKRRDVNHAHYDDLDDDDWDDNYDTNDDEEEDDEDEDGNEDTNDDNEDDDDDDEEEEENSSNDADDDWNEEAESNKMEESDNDTFSNVSNELVPVSYSDGDDEHERVSEAAEHNNAKTGGWSNDEDDESSSEEDEDEGWHNVPHRHHGSDSDEERVRKYSYKFPLDMIHTHPYLAINNQKILKWKFIKQSSADAEPTESCSFRIYSSVTKNFSSAYYVLDELIGQIDESQFRCLPINEIWNNLIKIACVQVFWKRLKVVSLLIKIMSVVEKYHDKSRLEIDLFALKPLKTLQYNLLEASAAGNSSASSVDDKNLQRALYELFFFAERLAIKFAMQGEYKARMKDQAEIVEMVCDTAYLVNIIKQSIFSAPTSSSKPTESKPEDESSDLDRPLEKAKKASKKAKRAKIQQSLSDDQSEKPSEEPAKEEEKSSANEPDESEKVKPSSNDEEADETVEEEDEEEEDDDVVRSFEANEDYDEDQDDYNDHNHAGEDDELGESAEYNSKKLQLSSPIVKMALSRFGSNKHHHPKNNSDDDNEP